MFEQAREKSKESFLYFSIIAICKFFFSGCHCVLLNALNHMASTVDNR